MKVNRFEVIDGTRTSRESGLRRLTRPSPIQRKGNERIRLSI
jgi:hypothetical protein